MRWHNFLSTLLVLTFAEVIFGKARVTKVGQNVKLLKQGRRFPIIKCCGHLKCSAQFSKLSASTSSKGNSSNSSKNADKFDPKTKPTEIDQIYFKSTLRQINSKTETQKRTASPATDVPVDDLSSISEQQILEKTSTSEIASSDVTFYSSTSMGLVGSKSTDADVIKISGHYTSAGTHPAITEYISNQNIITNEISQLTASDTLTITSIYQESSPSSTTLVITKLPSIATSTNTLSTSSSINAAQCEASRCEKLIFNESTSDALQIRSKGKSIVKNGKTYLLVPNGESQAQAAKNCFSLNMSLVAIPDVTKIKSIHQILKDLDVSNIWTVGSNEGNGSCLNYKLNFAWCLTNVDITAEISAKINGSSSADLGQKALVLVADSTGANFFALPSSNKLPYLCELNPMKTKSEDTCPSLVSAKNNSLFDKSGNLKDGEKYGKWIKVCKKMYLFSNQLGTWQQSWDTCNSLGMRPVWFQDASDMECLSNATKSNWTLNYNYWTAGRSQGSWGQWAWCTPNGPLILPDSLLWADGQPDNAIPDEMCLHLRVGKNGSDLALSDRNCSNKYVIACQGTTSLSTLCNKPSCPSKCEKSNSLFTGNNVTNLFAHGQWNSGCGKEYLFSSKSMIWADAWTYCCSLGMKLTSIEAVNELQCLTNMVAKYPAAVYPDQTGRDFWTSGSNTGCPGPHFWCSESEILKIEEIANWKNGKFPTEEAEMCIFLNLSNTTVNQTYLGEGSCTLKKPFICETLKAASKSVQIKTSCQEIWNVSDLQIDQIIMNKSGDVTTQERNLKCYIRCCGKKGNMIKGGNMVSDQILRGLEDLSSNDDLGLQSAFTGFDSCSTINHNDECEAMAKIFQCGKKTAPELTLGLVSLNKGVETVLPSPAGSINTKYRVCPAQFSPCTPDLIKINELKTTGNLSTGGELLTTSTGKKYFWKFVTSVNLAQAQALCCELGGNLITFETLSDYNAFVAIKPAMTGKWGYIYPTFDNGDGTDSWCSNFKKLPVGLIVDINQFYRNVAKNNQLYLNAIGLTLNSVGSVASFAICGPLPY
ncbi:uncharacterized protein LOC132200543 [Neocloeon triangulifer]|uniref:uncharacterized protein LOC132200543 n=1 Tax=Neocloeon triangulifer TaxID=2078957 RepID=UPI00286F676A|nr:uncharacterized protein LOC132200543 [Neocloeon triangulifer]XP_059482053.1 uncharacterized protein LOC132200543 [Neocloeon triangulifer]XP_059482055.1 uncharacterized protein LOC132200543 [Neocloeon triangulifer]XP_059482056.1 uncharacterized protein LOC132200543 [Neocloeon triangulifer]XP_059482057.1 uncharacterized protein LOC132200543 [Neocloeon triangulifer]